ncbi:MAG: DUF3592 domain-containing protein [Mycobacterium sp.]
MKLAGRTKELLRGLIHGPNVHLPDSRTQRVLRRVRVGVLVVAFLVTLQSALLMAGAWRNDQAIEDHMGVAQAEVLSAGPRRSTIEFVTPERITYRPELGVLYPSELATGMRIYVEYDTRDPDLVRVKDRDASLAIVPAGSIAVLGWLSTAAVLAGLAQLENWLARKSTVAVR